VLLVGLGVNALFGWSWADPIAALVIAAVAVKEGREAWKGDACCAPGAALHNDTAGAGTGGADDACGCSLGCTCCPPSDSTSPAAVTPPNTSR
jgi:hypothetical protein